MLDNAGVFDAFHHFHLGGFKSVHGGDQFLLPGCQGLTHPVKIVLDPYKVMFVPLFRRQIERGLVSPLFDIPEVIIDFGKISLDQKIAQKIAKRQLHDYHCRKVDADKRRQPVGIITVNEKHENGGGKNNKKKKTDQHLESGACIGNVVEYFFHYSLFLR